MSKYNNACYNQILDNISILEADLKNFKNNINEQQKEVIKNNLFNILKTYLGE